MKTTLGTKLALIWGFALVGFFSAGLVGLGIKSRGFERRDQIAKEVRALSEIFKAALLDNKAWSATVADTMFNRSSGFSCLAKKDACPDKWTAFTPLEESGAPADGLGPGHVQVEFDWRPCEEACAPHEIEIRAVFTVSPPLIGPSPDRFSITIVRSEAGIQVFEPSCAYPDRLVGFGPTGTRICENSEGVLR